MLPRVEVVRRRRAPVWVRDDGGRVAAGFHGPAGDCVVRAVAITTGRPYLDVYNEINEFAGKPVARTGVPKYVMVPYLGEVIGARWTPLMRIGSGCRTHVAAAEVPPVGRWILRLTKHASALVDGVVRDTHDPSRDGTRCVYGWWQLP